MSEEKYTGELVRMFRGHTFSVRFVAFSRDGQRILSGGMDNRARLWDAASGNVLAVLKISIFSERAAVVSADGKSALLPGRVPSLWEFSTNRVKWIGGD